MDLHTMVGRGASIWVAVSLIAGCPSSRESTQPGAGAPTAPPSRPAPPPAPAPLLELRDAPVVDVLETLARATNKAIVVAPNAQPLARCARVTLIAPRAATPAQLTELVSRSIAVHGLEVRDQPTGLTVDMASTGSTQPPRCDCGPADPPSGEVRGSTGRRPRAREADVESVAQDIRSRGAHAYEITRAAAERIVTDPTLFDARIVPEVRDGRAAGVRFFGIRGDSVPARLGLRNGDVLLDVNGHDLSSPQEALEAYSRLRRADELVAHIERGGQPVELRYRIVAR